MLPWSMIFLFALEFDFSVGLIEFSVCVLLVVGVCALVLVLVLGHFVWEVKANGGVVNEVREGPTPAVG